MVLISTFAAYIFNAHYFNDFIFILLFKGRIDAGSN